MNLKEFWESKSNADRRKIIVYTIAGIVSIALIAIVIALNTDSKEQEVADFSNPDAKEVEKYNSRAEANQMGRTDSADLNLAMDNMFGESEQVYKQEETTTFYEPDYSSSNNNSYSQPNYSTPSNSGSPSYNSHSTYGDYSMWQGDEPKNNSVGYSNKKRIPIENKSAQPDYTEIQSSPSVNSNDVYVQPNYNEPRSLKESKNVRAKLISQGYATSGRSLSFVILEETSIAGQKIKKGTIVTGVSQEQNNRLLVNFSSIKLGNKMFPAEMALIGSDGAPGLPISSGSNGVNVGEAVGDEVRNQAGGIVNRIPVVGGILGSVTSKKESRSASEAIKLSPNTSCFIAIY